MVAISIPRRRSLLAWAGKLLQPDQLGVASTLRTENEYQPKCSDVLWLSSKGRYGLFHLWINVWVAGKTDLSLTFALPERLN